MFLIVSALQKYGVTEKIATVLDGDGSLIKYGVASFLSSNVINNIPMSVLFGGVLTESSGIAAAYATIIGSNLGAYLTPVGALAGIMWTGLLKRYEVKFTFRDFILYGAVLSVPALCCSLLGLWLIV
jgi:arsenical pump membrane protein